MLTSSSLRRAFNITFGAAQNGRFLRTRHGTALDNLTSACAISAQSVDRSLFPTTLENVDGYAGVMAALVSGDAEQPTWHDQAMDDYIGLVSSAAIDHGHVIKTVIIPEIEEYVTALRKAVTEAPTPTSDDILRVVLWKMPAFITDPGFIDSISRFSNESGEVCYVNGSIYSEVDKDIFLKRGKENELDIDQKDIEAFIDAFSVEFLDALWNEFFNAKASLPRDYVITSKVSMHERLGRLSLVYLWCENLLENVAGETDLSLTAYNENLMAVRGYAGAAVYSIVEAIRRAEAAEQMVLEKNTEAGYITVIEKLYSDFLEKGGDVETLLGYGLSDKNTLVTITELLDSRQLFTTKWEITRSVMVNVEGVRAFDRYVFLAQNIFEAQLGNPTAFEQERLRILSGHSVSEAANNQVILRLMHEELAGLREADMDDIYGLAVRLVAGCRFYYTEAKEFLEYMTSARQMDKDLKADEAATLAMFDYVARYLANQFMVA